MSGPSATDLDRFLAAPAEPAGLRPYLDAAAVLAAFDPLTLRPVGGPAAPGPPDGLLSRCEPVTDGAAHGSWSLVLPERRAGLRRLAERGELARALAANPTRPDTSEQRLFEQLVTEPRALGGGLDRRPRAELAALHTLHGWAEGILDGLPPRAEIDRALAVSDLLAPMRRLTEGGFVGRRRELAQLGAHLFGGGAPAPLFVHGPGGVGKSTLIAHFVLDDVVARRVPMAYVDIDRPAVRAERPATILLPALAQLGAQLELPAGTFDSFASEIAFSLARHEPGRSFESSATGFDAGLLAWFADLVGVEVADTPVLLVVDTFEEAQFLGADVVGPLVGFLLDLDRALPELRIVASGRVLPDELRDSGPAGVDLGELDDASARELLRRGVPELRPAELDDVIGIVGRSPMCLKLATRLLDTEGIDRLRGAGSEVLSRLRAEKVQALLYGRVLRHLHGPAARAVAYPGLVVRRIAPDVIRDVLAGPCGLELRPGDEHAVFEELRMEAALVELDPVDGSLRHRTDVRRAVLDDLTDHVPPAVVEGIDRAAVAFYERRPGAVARAEEIYHRLRLREPAAALDARWSPEAADRLRAAVEELPATERLWLAHKLGVTVDPAIRAAASQEAWEEQAAASVARFLAAGAAERALDVLSERRDRLPRSPLYRQQVEVYRLLDRPRAALAVARAGVDATVRAGATDLALDLVLAMVAIEEGRDELASARRLAAEAAALATHSTDPVLRFQQMITGLRVHRRLNRGAPPAASHEAATAVTDELLHSLRSHPVLLREAAAELGALDARLTAAAIETLGVEVTGDAQATAFGHAIADAADSRSIPLDAAFLEGAQQFRFDDFDAAGIREWVTGTVTGRDTRILGRSLRGAESGGEALTDFQDYFRAGVDLSLRGPAGGDPPPPGWIDQREEWSP